MVLVVLPGITRGAVVDSTSVTSKGQVTIPKRLRQKLGLRQGSKVEFVLVGERVEMRVVSTPAAVTTSGFGLLTSKRASLPADFDAATLLSQRRKTRSR
jgi:AbrB family looped-hinge helix DNA binding protein